MLFKNCQILNTKKSYTDGIIFKLICLAMPYIDKLSISIMADIATNKRAVFDYELQKKYEAGLMLTGAEVKSVKNGHISLKGSFVTMHGGELYLTNANISPYPFAKTAAVYDPTRSRKLLVRKAEIASLIGKLQIKGLTLVPLRVYTKRRLIKLEFALAQGKKAFDKRASVGKRESDRRIRRALRSS